MPNSPSRALELQQEHRELCFFRAFPDSSARRQATRTTAAGFGALVSRLSEAQRHQLEDTGIAGTAIRYRFSFEVARWLAQNAAGEVSIDWDEVDDEERLDELLRQVLLPAEDEYFDSGYACCKEWLDVVTVGFDGTDFDWLMVQLRDDNMRRFWAQLYDAADLPLVWTLTGTSPCKLNNVFPVRTPVIRDNDLRGRPSQPKREIQRPIKVLRRLKKHAGARLIDVAVAALAVRHRETYHFNHANPSEVYLADVGKGVSVAVFGLLADYRYPLECTMGFLILSNGVPIGYGGSSILFRQINTGINLFDEFRGSEASYLWVQVMRVYHALTGCTRFIANAYQFGGDNDEAIDSGAFWFYYKLGYRPVDSKVRALAASEAAANRNKPGRRSKPPTLRRLASCDMHLILPGARSSDLIDEDWFATSSFLATRQLGLVSANTRQEAAAEVSKQVVRDLNIRSFGSWSRAERQSFDALAPFVAAVAPASWGAGDKQIMRKLMRAKGSAHEAAYARLLRRSGKFLAELRRVCRRSD